MNATIFTTCLGDTFYPDIVCSMERVFAKLGSTITAPKNQTCCGQPMFNAGYFKQTKKAARHFIDVFSKTEGPIVSPSASCTAMVRCHYPMLFEQEPETLEKAMEIASRIYEFTEYLTKELNVDLSEHKAAFNDSVTFHQSCHFRHLGITDEPANLIEQISGIKYILLPRIEQCCGFGGTFSVNYPHISKKMVADKVKCIHESGANYLVYADAGCAMNITGYAHKIKKPIKSLHIAELIDIATGGRKC
jgi:L-lactate dehydrogenase complex protein LldE